MVAYIPQRAEGAPSLTLANAATIACYEFSQYGGRPEASRAACGTKFAVSYAEVNKIGDPANRSRA